MSDRARPRQPRLGVDHDPVGRDQPGGDQRGQGQQGRRRVAAGHGHPGGAPQLLAVELGQAVRPGAELVGERVLRPVPGRVGTRVAQPEVGREVDDQPGRGQGPRGELGRPAMGQGAEQHVGALLEALVDRAEGELAVGGPQPGIAGDERLAGRLVARRPGDVEVGMAGQEAQQLGPGVARGAEHADVAEGSHEDSYAEGAENMQHLAELRISAAALAVAGAAWICKARLGQIRQRGGSLPGGRPIGVSFPVRPPAPRSRPPAMTKPPAAPHPGPNGAAPAGDGTPPAARPGRPTPSTTSTAACA